MMRSIFAAAVLLFSAQAMAVPMTFDFTGTMTYYFTAADSEFVLATDSLPNRTVSGSFTFDLDGLLPTSSVDFPGEWGDQTFRRAPADSTLASGTVTWASGTLSPTGFGPGTGADSVYAQNYASPVGQDAVAIADAFATTIGGVDFIQELTISFSAMFGHEASLPPTLADIVGLDLLSASQITGDFLDYSRQANPADAAHPFLNGVEGIFDIDSLTVRPTSVPEPGSVALLMMGLLGLGVVQWRRRVTPDA